MENSLEEDTFLTKGATVTVHDDPRERCLWELNLVRNELSFGASSIFEADGTLWLECAEVIAICITLWNIIKKYVLLAANLICPGLLSTL